MTSIGNGRRKGGMKQFVAGSNTRKDLSAYRHKIMVCSGNEAEKDIGAWRRPFGLLGGNGNKRYAVRPVIRIVMWRLPFDEEPTTGV